MGLFLRCNLFHGVDHQQVHTALIDFWQGARHRLATADPIQDDVFILHEQRNGWTALEWTRGWEWDLRRRAQLGVSRSYDCPGLLTFVYDGDYWGYELFHHGEAVDHFIQLRGLDGERFPGRSVEGRPDLLVAQFPSLELNLEHARGYLSSVSVDDKYSEDYVWDPDDEANRPVREGDVWGRRDAEAVFDFWRFLGVEPNSRPTPELFDAPVWRRFTTVPE